MKSNESLWKLFKLYSVNFNYKFKAITFFFRINLYAKLDSLYD